MTETQARMKFATAITALGVAYDKEVGRERTGVYWEALKDIPIDVLLKATAAAIRQCQFFPTVADLRRISDDIDTFALTAPRQLEAPEPLPGAEVEGDGRFCTDCNDSGFTEHVCRVGSRCHTKMCSEKSDEWEHPYMCVCGCRSINPVIRARVEAHAKKRYFTPKKERSPAGS